MYKTVGEGESMAKSPMGDYKLALARRGATVLTRWHYKRNHDRTAGLSLSTPPPYHGHINKANGPKNTRLFKIDHFPENAHGSEI